MMVITTAIVIVVAVVIGIAAVLAMELNYVKVIGHKRKNTGG